MPTGKPRYQKPHLSRVYELIKELDDTWKICDSIPDKNSEEYLILRYEIEIIKKRLNPCGYVKCYNSQSGYYICQFRYDKNGREKAKHFNPKLREIALEKIKEGATIEEMLNFFNVCENSNI